MSLGLDLRLKDPQQLAADPRLSAFVTANAGSGKTKTLIDRVARLLLAGAEPQTVLCVTYTKAAAAEMQRRLFGLLGDWSVLPDDELSQRLARLEARRFKPEELSAARALFARALETPGGLKIQTIHAFCEKLLRRFPIEAGVSPGFTVMDDAASAAVAAQAKADVARHALAGESRVAEAYARFSVALDFQSFETMFADFEARRGALAAFFGRVGGGTGSEDWVWRTCGFDGPTDPDVVQADAMAALDRSLWRRGAEALAVGGKQDQDRSRRMAEVAAAPQGAFDAAVRVFFTAAGEPAKWLDSSAILKGQPALQMLLLAEQSRLDAACARLRAAGVAADTVTALTLAQAYLAAYRVEKSAAGALDFTDLIEKTRALLASRPAAAWVLYKLDGGIDHILVDEAQDTALDQWEIVRALTAEFFSGAGPRGERSAERHMFVVGDEKQSIYSFQGAQPEQLIREFEFHRDRASGAGVRFERVDLLTSYRSTPQVLSFVDAVFTPPGLASAIQPRPHAEPVVHLAKREEEGHKGCVDLWDPEVEEKDAERLAWDAPLDAESDTSANRRLAQKIAGEIRALVERGDAVFDRDLEVDGQKGAWRAAGPGDVLILVRRRRALFEEILRALKQAGIPVAGADRLALSAHIVFDDLLAAARFALFPGDDLNLAALLKSPLCGLDDDSLYDLAFGRREGLWACLSARSEARPEWAAAHGLLAWLIEAARTAPPLEFFDRLLGRADAEGRSVRRRILTRLGSEAEDALDEFLAQVLTAEVRGLTDLESLVDGFARLDIMVKREMEAPAGQVRVMTAHGAKGLEAPIVILPETTLTRTARGSPLMETEDGGFLWCPSKDRDCEPSAAARARRVKREEDEAFRLLYVALTRARDRLVLCGRVGADKAGKLDTLGGWWGAISAGFDHPDLAPRVRALQQGALSFRRYGPDPKAMPGGALAPQARAPLPAWAQAPAAAEALGRYSSPSDLGEGAKTPAVSPLAAAGGLGRFRRGDLIHRLLQILPDLPAADWQAGAARLLARERDLTAAQAAEMAAAALSVLTDGRFAEVFGPGSRPEVAMVGTAAALPAGLKISGRIDRLVVLPDRVLVADFKTNRPSPASIEDADPAYLRQMAIYAAVLGEVFPGRAIEAALVWTDGPKLMPIPENLLASALADLGRGG